MWGQVMMWVPVAERLPKPFERVWIKTDTNKQTTGFVNSHGEWAINCPKIAAEQPAVVSWRE